MNFCGLGIERIDIPVPPNLESVFGYPNRRKWAAFYWESFVDRFCFEDGYSGGYINAHGWLAFSNHKSIQPTLAKYDFGSSGTDATHWLLLDRQDRIIYIGVSEYIRRFLCTFIDQLPFHSPKLFSNPHSDCFRIKTETFLDVTELQNRDREETEKINEMMSWLDNYPENLP